MKYAGRQRSCAWLAAAVAMLGLLVATLSVRAESLYPQNPFVTADGIFTSDHGVHVYGLPGLALRWRALEGEQTYEPVVAGATAYVGTSRGVFALNADSGDVLWHLATPGVAFSPVLKDDVAFIATRAGVVHAVRKTDGEPLWRRQLTGWVYPPVVAADVVIVGGRAATLWALEVDDGSTRWKRKLPQELVYRPVELEDGYLLVSLFDGHVLSVRAGDGHVRWRVRNAVASRSPAVIRGSVLLPGLDGRLRAHAASDGHRLWSARVGEGAVWPPRAAENGSRLVTGDRSGNIRLLNPLTGEIMWHRRVPGGIIAAPLPVEGRVAVFPGEGRPPLFLPVPGEHRDTALAPFTTTEELNHD